ncbi:MAG: hypothetical protein SFH39_06300 [Candidatus Magnetobacterium sp. LHC-1]|uniref:Uncharacterized protein n=1 Tax=Candidatus Magnetobacterium casense TaxID=1455061 RepID=A0ABS6RZY3_9BACT|nr:hypothetical protein [Candidatus Magnetobacterium casensis]MBF0606013.1 hypothetical protein [Nitrospirota bacterium]MBV6342162.1 hypothetical protein [Candidatus Magnetobacterium casensis]
MKTEKDRLLSPKYKQVPVMYKKSLRKKSHRVVNDFRSDLSLAVLKMTKEFKRLPNVKKLAYKAEGKQLTVWTFIDTYECNVLFDISNKELEIIEQFYNIDFDFNTSFNPDGDIPAGFIVDYLNS